MDGEHSGLGAGHGRRIAFVQSCWHKDLVDQSRSAFVAEIGQLGVAESEIDFLDGLQTAFALEEAEAKEVFEAARKHSGLKTLEEKSERVRHMMPAFVQCMAMMAAADEEIHHEERLGMRILEQLYDERGAAHDGEAAEEPTSDGHVGARRP